MLQFILTNLLMISLGGMLYLVVRTLPRIDEKKNRIGILERWVSSEIPERLDRTMHKTISKTLRKLKVYTMRADNSISERLHKLKKQQPADSQEELPFIEELATKKSDNAQHNKTKLDEKSSRN